MSFECNANILQNMKVLKRKSGYLQDPSRYFNFKRFEKKYGNFILVEAGFEEATLWNDYKFTDKELSKILSQKIVRLEFEHPNKFFVGDQPEHYDYQFYKIFTICPYTAMWLNKKENKKRYIPTFYPFNEEFIPKKQTKKFDVIYTGHILSKAIYKYVKIISKFNYRVVSNSDNSLVTNRSASYFNKMKLISQSKVTLVTNLLYLRPYHLYNVWKTPNYKDNKAFKLVPEWYEIDKWLGKEIVVPQLKSRLFEAAFGRSLILCRRDPFNIIERFFEPEKEFIYFDDKNFETTLKDILNNYSFYEKVIDRAYKRATKNYTIKRFAELYLKNI